MLPFNLASHFKIQCSNFEGLYSLANSTSPRTRTTSSLCCALHTPHSTLHAPRSTLHCTTLSPPTHATCGRQRPYRQCPPCTVQARRSEKQMPMCRPPLFSSPVWGEHYTIQTNLPPLTLSPQYCTRIRVLEVPNLYSVWLVHTSWIIV